MLPPQSLHIRDLVPGAQLKISMKAGMQVEQDFTGHAQSPRKPRRALGFSRTTFYAFLLSNDPSTGKMTINIESVITSAREVFTVTVEYKSILHLQQIIPYGRPVLETAPKNHPGTPGLGTKMAQLFPQPYLIPVRF